MSKITADQKAIAAKYVDTDMREHVLKKDMWTGPRQVLIEKDYYCVDIHALQYEYKKEHYMSPALDKICDEIIVNVIDHWQRNIGTKNPVTYLKVSYKDGSISIENNGPGIEVIIHPSFNKYVPEVISTLYLKGQNLDKNPNDITGGTNGLGMKLTNTYSTKFELETVDMVTGLKYVQVCSANMSVIGKPNIVKVVNAANTKTSTKDSSYTKITFTPDYQKLGYSDFHNTISETDFIQSLRTRLIMAKVYLGITVTVSFNDVVIDTTLQSIPRKIFGSDVDIYDVIIKDSKLKLHWEVAAVIIKTDYKTCTHFTNVNGVMIKSGTLIDRLYNDVYEKTKTKIKGALTDKVKMTKALVYSHLVLFINAKIPHSVIAWDGQRKDQCRVQDDAIAHMQFPVTFLNKLAIAVKDAIVGNIFEDNTENDFADVGKNKKDKYDKYEKCDNAFAGASNHKLKMKCRLLFPEGDSAETTVRAGLSQIGGFEWNGICTLGGNIVNARKEINLIQHGSSTLKVLSTKLKENALFKFLLQHTGLNINHKYDVKSESYLYEIYALKYGCFIVCVDQDLDGIGKIFSLFLNIFHVFWPNLLAVGFVKRFETPIIRAFKNGDKRKNYLEFYDDYEYQNWVHSSNDSNNNNDKKSKWTIKYYKGLAGHEPELVKNMFKRFDERLFSYIPDNDTDQLFEMYFGKSSDSRKDLLSTPVEEPNDIIRKQQKDTKTITLSFHLEHDTKTQKLSNINQKLHDVIGGMNEAGRKIFYGSYKYTKDSNEEVKVATLSGYISSEVKYHHGEASLEGSIEKKAFTSIGGKQLPIFIPESMFGSRLKGGDDCGSARYVYLRFNKPLMNVIFNPADNFALKYIVSEKIQVEPIYYVPIVPMVILETVEMPADGWKIAVWARDLRDVIKNVRRLIQMRKGNVIHNNHDLKTIQLFTMRPYIDPRFKGKMATIGSDIYTVGCYDFDPKALTITITELPLGVWNNVYIESINKKREVVVDAVANADEKTTTSTTTTKKSKSTVNRIYIDEILDHSSDTDVCIIIKITKAFLEDLNQFATSFFDGIQEFFLLRCKMNSCLNFMMPDGSVGSFDNYIDPILVWYPIREQMYFDRYEHDVMLIKLKIIRLENEIKYSRAAKHLAIDEMNDIAKAEIKLASEGFIKMNHRILANPKQLFAKQLEYYVLGVVVVVTNANASVNADTDNNNDQELDLQLINFDYLLDLRDREKVKEAVAKKEVALAKLQSDLHNLELITPYNIWENELDQLSNIYSDMMKNLVNC